MIATPSANLKTTTTPRAYDGHTSLYLPTLAAIVDVQDETRQEAGLTACLILSHPDYNRRLRLFTGSARYT